MADSTRRPDALLLLIVGGIVVFGLVILASATSVVGYQQFGDSGYFFKRQVLSTLIGILAFAFFFRIDYRIWRRFAFPLLTISVVLLVAVFLPGIGKELLGARRWIEIGPLFFQPAEIVKLTFLMYLAVWLENRKQKIHDRSYGLWPFLTLLGIITLLVVSQPDVGTMSIIGIIALASYFTAGAPLRDFALISGLAAGAFVLLVKSASYRTERFLVFLNPQQDPQGIGYHINQALLAIGSGGFFGLGLGHSQQKFNYLPEVGGDSIFAIVAEELGFVIAITVVALFLLLAIRGFRIAREAPDDFGKILASGITSWFAFQALINIGALTGILPLTGIPLPFISYGGTSLITGFAGLGILANISRHMKKG